jgi:hypothetical protein
MLAIGWWMIAALLPLLFWFIADSYEHQKKHYGGVRRVISKV